jgi:hypothetical protein
MADSEPPAKRAKRPRNVLLAEFEGLAKADASQALRDAGGDLDKARALLRSRRETSGTALLAQLRREREARQGPPPAPAAPPPPPPQQTSIETFELTPLPVTPRARSVPGLRKRWATIVDNVIADDDAAALVRLSEQGSQPYTRAAVGNIRPPRPG